MESFDGMTPPEHPAEGELLTVAELAHVVGIRRQVIERIVRLELIRPARVQPEPAFGLSIVPRVRKLVRLHYQLEVSWSSMELVLHLLDRIDELESRPRRGP